LSLDPQSAQGLEKNTPQHGVLFGMTGAGKSVIVADLLAQIGHRFGFRLIVEEGLSHAVLTQTQGCEPITVNPNEFFVLRNNTFSFGSRRAPKGFASSF
jgi:DNA repair ATPase RecN